ncbi:MAG TPA: multidrug DMT transporter permease [Bryobacteraceae bacterium]
MTKRWRFELFYFDYSIGVVLAAFIAALTFGNFGFDGFTFMDDLRHAGLRQDAWAMGAGAIFNLANMLLVAAISIAGMAVAFPVGIGLALVIGVIWNYAINPTGNKALLFGGTAIIVAAIIVDALAYRAYALVRSRQAAREGKARQVRKSMSTKGIIISLVAGVLMGSFFPLLQNAMTGEIGLGPYAVSVVFSLGVFFSTFVFNLVFMNLPIEGAPIEISDYFKGSLKSHGLGILGGMIWSAGLITNVVAAAAEGSAKVGPAVSYGFGQGATMVSALWGILAWHEFVGADSKVKSMIGCMLILFIGGLTLVSIAPLH